jgi:hypothetical protein
MFALKTLDCWLHQHSIGGIEIIGDITPAHRRNIMGPWKAALHTMLTQNVVKFFGRSLRTDVFFCPFSGSKPGGGIDHFREHKGQPPSAAEPAGIAVNKAARPDMRIALIL